MAPSPAPWRRPLRIAYLILAHNRPDHLHRLIDALQHPDVQFFVHVDRKADIGQFTATQWPRNVAFIAARTKAYWGGFSLVRAVLDLLRAALAAGPRFEYFILLSGIDYPLRSNAVIHDYLQRDRREYINMVELPSPILPWTADRLGQMRFERLSYYHHERTSGYSLEKFVALTLHKLNRSLRLGPVRRDYRKVLGPMKPFGGGQWWALSGGAVAYVMRFIAENPRFVRFFRFTPIPDETFFHTIVGNSPFAAAVAPSLTFDDWDRPEPPHPADIDLAHVAALEASGCVVDGRFGKGIRLFARKIAPGSEALLDRIDRTLRGAGPHASETPLLVSNG